MTAILILACKVYIVFLSMLQEHLHYLQHHILTPAWHPLLFSSQKGASLEIKDNDGNTPLSLALREGHDG